MDHPIGALPRTPFPASRDFPSRGNEIYEEKNRGVICFMYYFSISPFGGWRHHLARWEACHWIRGSRGSPMNPVPLPPPQAGALWVLSHGAMSLQESIERFILPPEQGEVRRSGKGGERSEPIRRMLIMPYDIESQFRNADFNNLRRSRHRHLQRRRRCRPLSEAIHNPPPAGGHNPRAKGPSPLTPQACPKAALRPSISHCKKRAYVINWYE